MASGGGSTASGDRRRYYAAAAAFRQGVEVMAGPGSFVGMRANGFGGWWRAAWARVVAQHGGKVAALASSGAAQAQAGGTGRRRGEQRCRQAQLQRPVARRRVARRRPAKCGGGSRADQRPWRAHGALASRGRRKRWQWASSSRRKGWHGGNAGHAERARRSAVLWPIWP